MDAGGGFQAGLTLEPLQLGYLQCQAGGGAGHLCCPPLSAPEVAGISVVPPPTGGLRVEALSPAVGSWFLHSCWAARPLQRRLAH